MPRSPAVERQYAAMDQAAEKYSISVRTIRRYIAAGKLTGYRIGPRLLRVDLNELDQLLRPIPTAGGGGAGDRGPAGDAHG